VRGLNYTHVLGRARSALGEVQEGKELSRVLLRGFEKDCRCLSCERARGGVGTKVLEKERGGSDGKGSG